MSHQFFFTLATISAPRATRFPPGSHAGDSCLLSHHSGRKNRHVDGQFQADLFQITKTYQNIKQRVLEGEELCRKRHPRPIARKPRSLCSFGIFRWQADWSRDLAFCTTWSAESWFLKTIISFSMFFLRFALYGAPNKNPTKLLKFRF